MGSIRVEVLAEHLHARLGRVSEHDIPKPTARARELTQQYIRDHKADNVFCNRLKLIGVAELPEPFALSHSIEQYSLDGARTKYTGTTNGTTVARAGMSMWPFAAKPTPRHSQRMLGVHHGGGRQEPALKKIC